MDVIDCAILYKEKTVDTHNLQEMHKSQEKEL